MRLLRTVSMIALAVAVVGLCASDVQAAVLDSVRVVAPDSGRVVGIDSMITVEAYVRSTLATADSNITVFFWLADKSDRKLVLADTTKNIMSGLMDSLLIANPGLSETQYVAFKRSLWTNPTPKNTKGDADTSMVATGPPPAGGFAWRVTWKYRLHASVGDIDNATVWAAVWDPNGLPAFFPPVAARRWATRFDGDRPIKLADLSVGAPEPRGAVTVRGFPSGPRTVVGIGDTLRIGYNLGPQADPVILTKQLKVLPRVIYGPDTLRIPLIPTQRIDTANVIVQEGQFPDLRSTIDSGYVELFLQEIASGNLSSNGKDDVVPVSVSSAASFLIDAKRPVLDGGVAPGDTILPVSSDTVSSGGKGQYAPRLITMLLADDWNPITYVLGEALKSLSIALDGTAHYAFNIAQTDPPTIANTADDILGAGVRRYVDITPGAGADSSYQVWNAASPGSGGVGTAIGSFVTPGAGKVSTGLYTATFQGTDVAGNVGPALVRQNVYVDVDPVSLSKLFPAKTAFGPVTATRVDSVEKVTARVSFILSEPAAEVTIKYEKLAGSDTAGARTLALSGSDLIPGGYRTYTVPGLTHKTQYRLMVTARDLAGNYSITGPDTFFYDTTYVVPVISRFAVAPANAWQAGISPDRQNTAGDAVVVDITAKSVNPLRDAVTYKAPAVLQVTGGRGITITGTPIGAVTDLGNGVALLSVDDWSAGKRSVTIRDTTASDSLRVTVRDTTTAGGPYSGQMDSLVVYRPNSLSQILVAAPTSVAATEQFVVGVTLADRYGNARLTDSRFVSVSTNRLGVEIPNGPVMIANGIGTFVAKANIPGTGLTFRVVDLNQLENQVPPALMAVTAPITVTGGATASIDAPDTLVAKDYMGADNMGDQGGFVVLTFPVSADHATLTGYRIYREITLPAGSVVDGAVIVEATDAMIPWARIDAVPGQASGFAIVATLDNVATRWGVAAERGASTSNKEAFGAAAAVATPYELMASTMVASRQAALQASGPVFATLTPEALAFVEKGLAPSMLQTDADLSAIVTTADKVRAIDNIAPLAVSYVRAMDTPADAGSSITVVWAKSTSDQMLPRFVGSAVGNGAISDVVPGVAGYNVYRKVGTGEYTLVGRAGAGETSFADLTALNGVRYTYKVQPYDQDNEAAGTLERTAVAIRNNAVDAQGKPVYGLFGADNRVGFDDFFVFADNFGLAAGDEAFEAAFDLVANGRVDFEDFFVFADNFGRFIDAPAGKVVPMLAGLNTDARLALDAGAQLPSVGGEVAVNVSLADFVAMKGYGFSVSYDATKLDFVKVDVAQNVLGDGDLAAPRVISQGNGQLSIAAYGNEATEGALALSLVFRTKTEIESSLIEVTESEVRDGNYAVNQIALPAPVQVQTRPDAYALGNNYPNPFNPATTIKYALPEAGFVKLEVYNVVGQVVRTLVSEQQNAGRYAVQWNASDNNGYSLSSGIYFYRLQAGDSFLQVKKMLLLK